MMCGFSGGVGRLKVALEFVEGFFGAFFVVFGPDPQGEVGEDDGKLCRCPFAFELYFHDHFADEARGAGVEPDAHYDPLVGIEGDETGGIAVFVCVGLSFLFVIIFGIEEGHGVAAADRTVEGMDLAGHGPGGHPSFEGGWGGEGLVDYIGRGFYESCCSGCRHNYQFCKNPAERWGAVCRADHTGGRLSESDRQLRERITRVAARTIDRYWYDN
jgi:hypothetical protein